MKVLVTGATGFIGGNIVCELLESGYAVKALIQDKSELPVIEGLDIEWALGDLRDRSALWQALDGCSVLFHTAALYSYWTPEPKLVYEVNVQGTNNMLEAARSRGIERIVFTSTESTIHIENGKPGTELLVAKTEELSGHYKKSKLLAEIEALGAAAAGMPIVVVNPTLPIGPGDHRPTPSGRIIVDYVNGKMPAFVDTLLNFVDVRDVAAGHRLAMEKGRVGERYILGNRNLTLMDFFRLLEAESGIPVPKVRLPFWVVLAAAYCSESIVAKALRKEPRIAIAAVRAAKKRRYFDCSKAIRELGFPQSPIEKAIRDALNWYKSRGYLNREMSYAG